MVSSRFGILNGDLDKNYKFTNDIRKHEIDGQSVEAHINFSKPENYNGIEVVSGTIIDFKNTKSKQVTFNDKNMPHLTENYNLQAHQIEFFILDKKYIQTELSGDLPMLMRNVNHSLPSKIDFHNVQMYIEKINVDYPKQWYAFEQNDRKHVTTTKVFGNDIVKDHIQGGATFTTVPKNDVGISDKIDEKPVELRVTKNGLFQFPENSKGQYYPTLMEIAEYFIKKMSFYAS